MCRRKSSREQHIRRILAQKYRKKEKQKNQIGGESEKLELQVKEGVDQFSFFHITRWDTIPNNIKEGVDQFSFFHITRAEP